MRAISVKSVEVLEEELQLKVHHDDLDMESNISTSYMIRDGEILEKKFNIF